MMKKWKNTLSEVQQREEGGGDSGNSTSTKTQQPDPFTLKEECIKTLFMLYIETQHK